MLETDKKIKEKLDTIETQVSELWSIADAFAVIAQPETATKLAEIASQISRAKISLSSLLRLNGKENV